MSGRGAGGPRGRGAAETDGAPGGGNGGLSLITGLLASECGRRGELELRAGLRVLDGEVA